MCGMGTGGQKLTMQWNLASVRKASEQSEQRVREGLGDGIE